MKSSFAHSFYVPESILDSKCFQNRLERRLIIKYFEKVSLEFWIFPEIIDFMIQNPINKRFKRSRLQCHRGKIKKSREKEHEFGSYRQELEVKQRMNGQLDVINAWKGRTSCTSFVRCNDMWLAKDNRFMNPMSTYEWNLMAPTCLIINYFSCQIPILGSF